MSEKKNIEISSSSSSDAGANLRNKIIITSLVSVFLIGGIILLYIFLPAVVNKSQTSAIVRIPANATFDNVRDSLSKYFGDKYANKVLLISKFRGSDYSKRHGAYMIDSGIPPYKTERILTTGAQHPVKITINGFRHLDRMSDKIAAKLDLTQEELLTHLHDNEFLNDYELTSEQNMALFIDDTYFVNWSASPKELTDKIGAHYRKIWNKERIEKAHNLGLSPAEVITLASIVDEETNKQDEKPKVARLYLNRLQKGMKLQADPTVKFALRNDTLRRIRNEHLSVNSPYNTYKIYGLPPGPIRTVSVSDIDAVLNAPVHNYIYMCAKEDFSGYHNFAKDYSTHMQNAHKYQKALNRRNIR